MRQEGARRLPGPCTHAHRWYVFQVVDGHPPNLVVAMGTQLEIYDVECPGGCLPPSSQPAERAAALEKCRLGLVDSITLSGTVESLAVLRPFEGLQEIGGCSCFCDGQIPWRESPNQEAPICQVTVTP